MAGWHILLGQYAGVLAIATHHCHTSLPHINQSFGYLPRDISKEQHWLQCRSLACKQKVTVDCQTRAGNSCKEFPSWERCDGRFPNRHSQKHDFYRVLLFALSRQELSSTRTMLLKRNFRNIIVKQVSKWWNCHLTFLRPFLGWGVRSDNETAVGKRLLHLWIIGNFDRGLHVPLFLQGRG